MKQVFELSRIRFVEVSEQLVEYYLTMVNDYENVNRFIGGSIVQAYGVLDLAKEISTRG